MESSYYYQTDLVQAYRLYTLALAKDPEIGAMNRMKELKNLSVSAAWRLAAAYVLIGQKEEAQKLIQTAGKEIKQVERFNYTFGSDERDWAMMLETLCLLNDKTAAFPLAKKISAVLSSNSWLSTQSTAYCLLSISKFLEIADVSNEIKFSYQLAGKQVTQVSTRMPVAKVQLPVNVEGTQTLALHNFTKGTLFVRVITEGIPETGSEIPYENSLKMSVVFQNNSGSSVDVSRLSQGTDFSAVVTVKSLFPSITITNLALSQVFPSGWEISNTRFLSDNSEEQGYTNFTYQDFRDDRVNTFFDLPVNGSKTFKVKLTATYSGKFYLPGTLCEAMYEPGINAFVPGKWIEVVK
jgi:alpha-2-macroglobulin